MANTRMAVDPAAATGASSSKPYDLLFLLDATYSMNHFINGLHKALPDILRISALTDSFERIGVMAYRDYSCADITAWSGWCRSTDEEVDGCNIVAQKTVIEEAAHLKTQGNDDTPEASKTGLAFAYEKMRQEAITLIVLYTDAPPHLKQVQDRNHEAEQAALLNPESYGGTGHHFADWTSAAKMMRDGPKKANVFCLLRAGDVGSWSAYQYLSEVTGGLAITLPRTTPDAISLMTTSMLLTWMGIEEHHSTPGAEQVMLEIPRYKSTKTLLSATSEDDPKLRKYFVTQLSSVFNGNSDVEWMAINKLGPIMTKREPAVGDFAENYVKDENYRELVVSQLKHIFEQNVVAMSLNPIFGSLWRAVCNGKGGQDRDVLAPIFGYHVDKIENPQERAKMQKWLEQSYDYSRTIQKEVAQVPAEHQYPLVYLDPTTNFANGNPNQANGDLRKFERAELLEIGRSCDGTVLRRLGKVLTQLTVVASEKDLPAHVKGADGHLQVPYVPLALAQPEFNRRFWRILLHTVLPGTMLAARAAAVLAALSLRMGISSLTEVADAELLAFGPRWNNIETPENWSPGCMQLMLNASQDFEQRVAAGTAIRPNPEQCILTDQDRAVFQTLLDYKLLERYVQNPIEAKVNWRPEKNQVAVGPLVTCSECNFPRSVTIMGPNGVCGMCCAPPASCPCTACMKSNGIPGRMCANVSKEDGEDRAVPWVECSVADCRAQYVVYNPKYLGVRAKCFYCRHTGDEKMEKVVGKAPWVECGQCLSRTIWPHEYRPEGFDEKAFRCPGCMTGVQTVVLEEITPNEMEEENGWGWLLKNVDNAIEHIFDGRSIFYTATHCDLENIPSKIELLPLSDETILTIKGKKVQNIAEIKESLRQRIQNRESNLMSCSLCFSDLDPTQLRSACGRSGCKQRICSDCIKSWYSLNKPGKIINTAALSCPFCRRIPAGKIARRHRITDIGSLAKALTESGTWIHAWCWRCNHAKEYVERVCANGAPEPVSKWVCDGCKPVEQIISSKFCPGCGVLTQKISGCHHITCPCGQHWCYACGEAHSVWTIYRHIAADHGGLAIELGEYETDDAYESEED